MRVFACLIAAGLVGACATSAPVASAPAPEAAATPQAAALSGPAAGSVDKKICKQMKVMGSNMPRRECQTAAEWAAYEKQGADQVETFKREIQSSGTNPPLGENGQ